MANSEVELVNSAFVKIGESTITSLTQNTENARVANKQYPLLRDQMLRAYRWNFAIQRQNLAPGGTPKFGFSHSFRLPTDCLRVLGIFDDTELLENYTSSRIQWKMESVKINEGTETEENELRLLTTEEVTRVFYIARITNVQLFDSQFSEALALKCAIDWAYTLSTGLGRLQDLKAESDQTIRRARLSDAIEGKPEVIEATDWIEARFDSSDLFGPRNRNATN